MERLKIVRVRDLDEPEIDLSLLNGIAPVDAEAFRYMDYDQWEEYLKEVTIELGSVILIGFNNGDVDVIITVTEKWVDAVTELREWLGESPIGGSYEIYWRFNEGSVRRYSMDY